MLLVVACALIDRDGKVLLAQRPADKKNGGLWEFPGGKIDPGEEPGAALIRELREELGINTEESCLAPLSFSTHADILILLYVCRKYSGIPAPLEGQGLAWSAPEDLMSYDLCQGDRPLAAAVRDLLA